MIHLGQQVMRRLRAKHEPCAVNPNGFACATTC